VATITPIIIKLLAQLKSENKSQQPFADTASTEMTKILQRTAQVVLTKMDPLTSKRDTATSHQDNTDHHFRVSQNPLEP